MDTWVVVSMNMTRRVSSKDKILSFAIISGQKHGHFSGAQSFRRILFNESGTTQAMFMKIIWKRSD